MRVAPRLMFTIMITFVVVCLVFLSINLFRFGKNAYFSFEQRARYLTDLAVNANAINVWNFDLVGISHFARILTKEETVEAVIFEIGDPQLEAHGNKLIGYEKGQKAIEGFSHTFAAVAPRAGAYTLYFKETMKYKGQELGVVHVYFTDAPIVAEVKRQALTFIVLMACFVLLYASIIYLAMRTSFLQPFKNIHGLALWVSKHIEIFNDHFTKNHKFDFEAIPRLDSLEGRYLADRYRADDIGDFVRAFIGLIEGFSMVVAELSLYSQQLERMNDGLEAGIKNRTIELASSNQRLQESLDSLKQTQSQLIQQEKLASIGQLAAGVAHEINNPIGYVSSNLNRIGEYFADVLEMVDAFQGVISGLPESVRQQVSGQLSDLLKKFDYEFIKTDVPDLLGDCREGALRVRGIVQSLKDFSRSEQGDVHAEMDINDSVKTTLKLVLNELKYDCDLIQDYQCTVDTMANVGQINQVVSNLLVNAGHAIKATKTHGEITIKTYNDADFVVLEVGDSGCGIPEEARPKVFDPFFTTKPVGQGTGLGLNICYDIIVNKHAGKLSFITELGKGTTFTVKLPIKKPSEVTVETVGKGA